MLNRRTVRVKDDLTWQEFGAPDPAFFDRFIKDRALEVVSLVGDWYTVQDPTDLGGVFTIHAEWLAVANPYSYLKSA